MNNYQKKIDKALRITFYITVSLLIIGSTLDIFTVYSNDSFILTINISTALLVLIIFFLEIGNILKTKTAFGIAIILMIINLYAGLFFYDKEIATASSSAILYRESIIILVLISISSFFVNRYLSYIILLSYFIIYFLFASYHINNFVLSNSLLIIFIFTAYTFVIGYFTNILNRILKDLQNKNRMINENLEEIKVQNQQLQSQQETISLQNSSLLTKNNDLKKHREKLKELNQTKDKFFSIIAHDLKSPFNSILGFSTLLTERIKENNLIEANLLSQSIYTSSKDIYILLNNLLEWARLQTGKIDFNPEWFNFEECTNDVIKLMTNTYQAKNIIIKKEIEPDLKIFADRNMIDTVIRNLISNAIKYSYEKGEIVIKTIIIKDELQIEISDTGVGIQKENIKKLFRLDSSFTKTGTAKEKGTGLGLILCKDFIEYHNGKIWVESEYEKGSKFCFTLPKLLSKK